MTDIDPRDGSTTPQGDAAKTASQAQDNNPAPPREDDADDYFGLGDNPG